MTPEPPAGSSRALTLAEAPLRILPLRCRHGRTFRVAVERGAEVVLLEPEQARAEARFLRAWAERARASAAAGGAGEWYAWSVGAGLVVALDAKGAETVAAGLTLGADGCRYGWWQSGDDARRRC